MYNPPYDKHYCFSIYDFQNGDSVIVMVDNQRVKGRVSEVNESENIVYWKSVDNVLREAVMDDFVYLAQFDKDWI